MTCSCLQSDDGADNHAIICRKQYCLIEISLKVFLIIYKKQYNAKPTTGTTHDSLG